MRNFTLYKWLLAVLLLLMPLVAAATGLGRLAVLSSLGQPLDAEIELMSVRKEDLSSLSVRIASPEAYRRANLQYNAALTSLRLAVRTRPDGSHFVKITSSRPVSEPFVDLLIEVEWASGRLSRQYTALIDPPGYVAGQATAPGPALAETRAAPTPVPPVAAIAPTAPIGTAPIAAPGAKEYGPIRRGETLYSIAGGLKRGGVTLEQMLVGLYRANPDAFAKNMNRMKTGKILRVPDAENLASVTQKEALQEIRVQVSDWNTYRQTLAGAAGTAPESRIAARGKITPRLEEKEGGGAKDVVRLSKGEPATGAAGSGKKGVTDADRVRALEEELIAREKALNEANDRIAQLNKTLEDLQKKLEIKSPGMAAAVQQQEAAKAEMKKPESTATPVEARKEGGEAGKPAVAGPSEPKPAPKPKPKAVVPQSPPPEPSLVDTLLAEPMYLAAGAGVILLGGLAFLMARRRRSQTPEEEETERAAPTLKGAAPEAAATAPSAPSPTQAQSSTAAVAPASADEIDPLDEAEVHVTHGRDQQAEAILKEAIAKNPNRTELQLKLLEVYAARKDRSSFDAAAEKFNKLSGGQGADWLRVAAMGYALAPDNPAYVAGKDIAEAAESGGGSTTDLDFDLGAPATAPTSPAPEIPVEKNPLREPAAVRAVTEPAKQAQPAPAMPDFTLEVPDAGSPQATDIAEAQAAPREVMDFNIELPRAGEPGEATERKAAAPEPSGDDAAGLDFKLDIPNLDLNLDEKPAAGAAGGGEKDAHWYDVQTKFDLVRAYQEIGEKDGARQLLQEVLEEGDAQQQSEAKKLLDSLG